MRKRLGLILGVAAAVLAGCGSGGGGTSGGRIAFGPLAGVWRATSLTGGGSDIPCPAVIAGAGATGSAGGTVPTFGCGASDTFTFRDDNTFTVTTVSTTSAGAPVAAQPATYTGRWAQFQTRVMLSVDGANATSFPYVPNFDFRSANEIAVPVVGFDSVNRYRFTRQ